MVSQLVSQLFWFPVAARPSRCSPEFHQKFHRKFTRIHRNLAGCYPECTGISPDLLQNFHQNCHQKCHRNFTIISSEMSPEFQQNISRAHNNFHIIVIICFVSRSPSPAWPPEPSVPATVERVPWLRTNGFLNLVSFWTSDVLTHDFLPDYVRHVCSHLGGHFGCGQMGSALMGPPQK